MSIATRRAAAAAAPASKTTRGRTKQTDARTPSTVENRYDAAGAGRRMRGWTPPSTGPQRAVEGLAVLRNRSRDAERNDWAAGSAAQKWVTTLVGVGITPRWSEVRHAAIWEDFGPQADADGVLDVYGLQALGVRSWFTSGEAFLRRRWRDVESPLDLPVQFQLIESDFCPLFDSDQWPGMAPGNTIRQGIERDKYGRRVAYWMHREHPGDSTRGFVGGTTDLLRIPARDIAHVYEPKRAGQLRGVPEMAPVLARIRASGDLEDAVLDRQKLANLFTLFLQKALPTDWKDIEVDPKTGLPVAWDSNGQPMAGLEPGAAMELLPGETATFANPPEAGVSYPDYLRSLHLGTSAGSGLPYEFLSGDLRDVSDRALRVIVQELRRFAKQRQWHLIIPMICRPMVAWLGEAAVLKGRLRASELKVFTSPTWSPHGWDYLHPVQDVQGKKLEVEAGFASQSEIIAEKGNDPRETLDQRQADRRANEERGLPAPGAAVAPAKSGAQKPPDATASGGIASVTARLDALASRQDSGLLSVLQSMQAAQAAALERQDAFLAQIVGGQQALALALATRPIEHHTTVAPPVIENRTTVAPPSVENHVHVEPTPVTITNQNNVEAPVLKVEATLHMPDRRSETVFEERDDDGNVKRAVTTQTTIQ